MGRKSHYYVGLNLSSSEKLVSFIANGNVFVGKIMEFDVKEPSLKLDTFLLQVYQAIEKDDSVALNSLVNKNRDLIRAAASEKYLVLEAFKRNAQKCMKYLLNNLEFESKERQVRAVEDYILKKLSKKSQVLNESELDCVQLLNTATIEDKIFERKAVQVEPSEHVVYFRAFLRSKGMTPMQYLPNSVNEKEKFLCLSLL